MTVFPLWSCENYPLVLPVGHPFPSTKYALLEKELAGHGFVSSIARCEMASRQTLELVHDPRYVERVLGEQLTPVELRKLGFPQGFGYACRAAASVQATCNAMEDIFERTTPELVFFQSGVDVLAQDRFGRLGLSLNGLWKRDCFVFEECLKWKVPVVITLGGGYQLDHSKVAAAHAQTFFAAREILTKR